MVLTLYDWLNSPLSAAKNAHVDELHCAFIALLTNDLSQPSSEGEDRHALKVLNKIKYRFPELIRFRFYQVPP